MDTYSFCFLQVTSTLTVYFKHFLLNLVEVNSASQVAHFLVDSLSSLDKNTLCYSVGCYNIPLVPNIVLLQCQMIPLTVPLESKCSRYSSDLIYVKRLLDKM
jgi:hypothetical protein